MLTQTLRGGYVERIVFPTKPPSVEYQLTQLGQPLYVSLSVLLQWAEANYPTVREARRRFDEELAATG